MTTSNVHRVLETCVSARRHAGVECELEIRLGSFDDDKFLCGVSRDVFEQFEREMLNTPLLTAETGWTEVIDYYYTGTCGNTLRTRVEFDTATMSMQTTHIRKETRFMASVKQMYDDACDACRVTMAVEHPVDPPTSCVVTFVRIKQRRRFFDVRNDKKVWVYELSRTWAASTRTGVEHRQKNTEPKYEVECELVDEDGSYLKERSDAKVAESVAMKMKVLLGGEVDLDLMTIGKVVGGGGGGEKRRR